MILFYLLTHLPLQVNDTFQKIYLISGEVSLYLLLIYMSIQAKKMTPKSRGYNLIRTLLVVYGLIVFLARLDHIFRPTHVLGLITNKYGLVNQQPLIILLLLLEFSTSKKKIFIKMDSPCDKWPLFDNNYAYSKPIYTF